jgi:hypothetical protein
MVRRVLLRLFPTSSTAALLRLSALAVFCFGVVSALPAGASAAGSGPVAEYSFDGGEAAGTTAEDLAGENDGTIEGATWAPGRYGDSLSFENPEDCVTVPDSESLQLGEEATVEAWVKPTGALASDPIVFKEAGSDFSYVMGLGLTHTGRAESYLRFEGEEENVRSPEDVEVGVWTHLAVTYDGAYLRLYVNGALTSTQAVSNPGSLLTSEGPLHIGCAPAYNENFRGRIDEVRVYDRALSAAEVGLDMETPLETPKAGPVAEWSFDEGKGTTAADLTGHGHTATISKATWTRGRFGDALKFDGKSSCASVAGSSELDFNEEFTLETWVRPEGLGLHSVIAQEDEAAAESEDPFAYALLSGDEENEGPRIWVRHPGGERGSAVGPTLPQGAWSHLAVTDDGAYLRFYVNGDLTDTQPAVPLTTGSGPLTIGCMPIYGDYFKGRVDEVRVYGRTLTGAEVDSDMEAPVQTPKSGPVADYSFDEGSGETVEDLTGNGHTATLQGADWTTHGRYGGALDFKAANEDFVSIPASAAFNGTEELTVEAWVRPTASSGWGGILMKEREGTGARYSYALYQHDEGAGARFHDSEEGELASPSQSLPPDAWTHLAITDNGAASHLYVNGELVDTMPALPIEGNGEIRLGGNDVFGDYFSGRIDELRLYDRTLTPAEVAVDMESPLVTPKAGPVADYSFDEKNEETQADTSGNGHAATVEGAKWTERGRYGGAMEFDGENDQLTIPDSEDLRFSEEFTLEAWVRPNQIQTFMPVVAKTAPGEYGYALYATDGNEPPVPQGFLTEGEYVHGYAYSGHVLDAHAWTHLAVTFDGAHIRFFFNGVLVDTRSAEDLPIGKGPLTIGGDEPFADGGFFDGRIDEIRVYNRSLNEAEVATDMAAPIHTPQQGPIAAWSFDEVGEGGTVEDVTGNEHTGTVEGAILARGKYGQALQFDGENDVVKVPSSPDFALTEGFTAEAWVRPESESNEWAPILAKEMGGGEATNELAWWLYEGDWNANEPFGGTEPTPGNRDEAHADDPLPVDAWSHVALTYDGAQVRLYINGELVDCSPVPAGAPPVTNGELQIGAATELGTYYKGRIDEVRIYNRPLNEAELQSSMSATFPTANTTESEDFDSNDALLTGIAKVFGSGSEYYFEYGTTEEYGNVANGEEITGNGKAQVVHAPVFGIAPETTYHYRVVVEGPVGTSFGKDQTVTTGARTISAEEEEDEEEAETRAALMGGSPGGVTKLTKVAHSSFFGIDWSGNLVKMADPAHNAFQAIEETGAEWVRIGLYPGREGMDKAFEEAKARGLKVIPYIGDEGNAPKSPAARKPFLDLAQEMLEEHGSEVEYWEIGNEPNMPHPGQPVNAQAFASFYKAVALKMRSIDPTVQFLTPGLYGYRYTTEDDKKAGTTAHETAGDFLEKFNAALAGGTELPDPYAGISLHPYIFKVRSHPKDGKEAAHGPRDQHDAERVRTEIGGTVWELHHQFNAIPIWVTELGFPLKTSSKDLHPAVSQEEQALLTKLNFSMLLNKGVSRMNVAHSMYYNIEDNPESPEPDDWARHSGLISATGHNRRPAWTVFKELVE